MADTPDDTFGATLAELDEIEVELGNIETISRRVSSSLTNALKNAILEGKSLKSVLGQVANSLADIALSVALKPLGALTAGVFENLFAGALPFAKGGVVAAPTFFSTNGGLGLAGEAGPEAILPLRRGKDGRLGVASAGQAGPTTINVSIATGDAQSFVAAEAEISALLLRAVRQGQRAS